MIFTEPQPFDAALESRAVRSLLPTDLRTADLAAIAPDIRERAIFSSGVTSAEFLQEADDAIQAMLYGELSQADARLQIQEFLGRAGYSDGDILGTDLQALSSIRRQNMILETNAQMARGYGQYKQAQQADVLDAWPAQELVRVTAAEVPRQWHKRWTDAGGEIREGRLIALKNDPIWRRISRFELPYPPFDFNSGMGLSPVNKGEAIRLGLISEDSMPQAPQSRPFNQDLESNPRVRSANLRTALETALRGFAAFGEDGVLRKLAGA